MWSLLQPAAVLGVVCQAGHVTLSMEDQKLQSFVCPFLSRHVEVWDELPDEAGFKTRFGSKMLAKLPAECTEQEEAKMDEPRSFLQVGLKVNRLIHQEADDFRPALVPYPKSVSLLDASEGTFVFSKRTTISLGSGVVEDAPYVAASLADLRKRISDATSQLPDDGNAVSHISLGIITKSEADPESYTLTVRKGQVQLDAHGPAGFSHGVTTLQQLIPFSADRGASSDGTSLAETSGADATSSRILPAMVIEDGPAFKWRGLHLDVSRHFFPAEDVMKLLSTMAAYKLNRFHWHLTDDQGWRFPVRGYPELTRKGAGPRFTGDVQMSSGDGIEGSYTEQDIRDVLDFAKARHIQVIPEVDVPGHVAAAVAAYPELGNRDFEPPAGPQHAFGVHKWTLAPTRKSAEFLEAVFNEIARVFPDSEYIHLGGDEAPQDQWQGASEDAKKEWDSFEGSNAQSYFSQKVSEIIHNKGKKMAGWDEVQSMAGLPQDAAIFAWRGENELRKALANGRQAINADNGKLYFDHYQGPEESEPKAIGGPLTTAKHVYQFHPIPSWVPEEQKHLILGGQAELWSEYFPNWKQVEYMAFPRAIALAERLWTPEEELSYPDFSRRCQSRLKDLKHWGVNFHPLES